MSCSSLSTVVMARLDEDVQAARGPPLGVQATAYKVSRNVESRDRGYLGSRMELLTTAQRVP